MEERNKQMACAIPKYERHNVQQSTFLSSYVIQFVGYRFDLFFGEHLQAFW